MRNIIKTLLAVLALFLIGCNDSSNNNSNPIGFNPIGGGGNVTFQLSLEQNQQGINVVFFKPSVDIKLIKIVTTLNNQQTEEIAGDGTTVYKVSEGFSIEPTNVKTGDVYSFVITGKIATDNKDFTTTVNFTIPQVNDGGANNVTFQVSVQQDQQGGSVFLFNPNVDIKLDKLDATLNGQAAGTVNGDGATIYTVADGFPITVNNPSSGDKWVFVIIGKIAKDGKAFTSTINYTVP